MSLNSTPRLFNTFLSTNL